MLGTNRHIGHSLKVLFKASIALVLIPANHRVEGDSTKPYISETRKARARAPNFVSISTPNYACLSITLRACPARNNKNYCHQN